MGVEVHVGCGQCPRCLEGLYQLCQNYGRPDKGHAHIGFTVAGGLAEYAAVSVKALHKLPDQLSWDEGAFCDNVGIASTPSNAAGCGPGERVARLRACADATVVAHGDDALIDARCAGGEGADLVVEFAGTPKRRARPLAGAARRTRGAGWRTAGRELCGVDLSTIVRGHLDIYGALANPRGVSQRGLELIARGLVDVSPLITHHASLDQFADAWATFVERRDGAIRVMLHP